MEGIRLLNFSRLWSFLRNHLKIERTYILPSKLGLYYAVLCLILLVVAFIYGNNIAYASCFMLVSLGIVTIFQTNFNVHRVSIKTLPIIDDHAEHPVSFKILLENKSSLPSFQIQIRLEQTKNDRKNSVLKDVSQEVILINQLGANQKKEVELSLIFTRRGFHKPPIVVVESYFPLGLLRSWKWIHPTEPILIYPAKKGILPLPQSATEGGGNLLEKLKTPHTGQEFIGHRPYQTSDSLRKVDWKAFSRNQKLNVKLFDSEEVGAYLLNWESTNSLKDTEARVSQLTQWINLCQRKKVDFVLQLPQWQSSCGHSSDKVRECYQQLALFRGSV